MYNVHSLQCKHSVKHNTKFTDCAYINIFFIHIYCTCIVYILYIDRIYVVFVQIGIDGEFIVQIIFNISILNIH